jgi:farnesol dehydrogenase
MSKKIFITGATGFIGGRLAGKLASQGHQIVALVRSPHKASPLAQYSNITILQGSLSDTEALETGMQGAEEVYHLAAYASVWARDDSFERVNVEGTIHVLNAALKKGVSRIVVTSTAGVIGPMVDGKAVSEQTERIVDFFNDYERTKYEAELIVQDYAARGLHAVIVNPTRVFGPGPLNESNAVTKLIKQYAEGSWRFLPGDGQSAGNYVYVDDVVEGHLLAMQKGRPGERYLLGGTDVTYSEFFDTIGGIVGKKHQLYRIPLGLMLGFGKLQMFLAEQFGKKPMITPSWVKKYLYQWRVSSAKAKEELGYQPISLESGIQKTIEWLKSSDEYP